MAINVPEYDPTSTFDLEVTQNINTLVFTDSELSADFTQYVAQTYNIHLHCKVNFANLFDGIPIPAHDHDNGVTGTNWHVRDETDAGADVSTTLMSDIDSGHKPFARRLRNVLVNGELVHTRGFYEKFDDEKDVFNFHKNIIDTVAQKDLIVKQYLQLLSDASGATENASKKLNDASGAELHAAENLSNVAPSDPGYAQSLKELQDASGARALAVTAFEGRVIDGSGAANDYDAKFLEFQKAHMDTSGVYSDTERNPLDTSNFSGVHFLKEGVNDVSGSSYDIMEKLVSEYIARSNRPLNLEWVNATTQNKLTVEPAPQTGVPNGDHYWTLTESVEEVMRSAIQATNFLNYQASDKTFDPSDTTPRLLPSTDISREYLIDPQFTGADKQLRVETDVKMESTKMDTFAKRAKVSDGHANSSVWNGAFFTSEQAGELLGKMWEFETESRRAYREKLQKADPGAGQIRAILTDHIKSNDATTIYNAYVPRMEFVVQSGEQSIVEYTRFPGTGFDRADGTASGAILSLGVESDGKIGTGDIPVDAMNTIDSYYNNGGADYDGLTGQNRDTIRYGKFNSTGFQLGDKISSVLDMRIMHGDRTGNINTTVAVDTYRVKLTLEHAINIPREYLWEWDNNPEKFRLVNPSTAESCYPQNKEARVPGIITAHGNYFKQYDHATMNQV